MGKTPVMARKKSDEAIAAGEYLDASYILDRPKKIVKVSPALDYVLNGGVPEGIIMLLESLPKIGKTSLALKIAACAQQQFDKVVVYVSIENRLSLKNLKGVKGLDLSADKFKIITSTEGNILSAEHQLERTEKALHEFPGCICIFDSFSALSTSDEKTKNYGDGFGNVAARKLEGEFARRISPIIAVNNNIIIGIAHLSQNLNMPGSTAKVSRTMLHQMDTRLSLKKVYPQGDWMSGETLIGQKVNIECIQASALGPPGRSCVAWLKYGTGFSSEAELADLAISLSVIKKSGTWYNLEEFGYETQIQGMDKLTKLIEENSVVYNQLLEKVNGILYENH